MSHSVLVVDDEVTLAKNLARYLHKHGYEVNCLNTGSKVQEHICQTKPDLLLLDYRLPDSDGLSIIKDVRASDTEIKIMLMTGDGGIDVAVEAMRYGANDYLSKPIVMAELKLRVERVMGESALKGTLDYYKGRQAQISGIDKIIGDCPSIRAVKQQIAAMIDADERITDGQPPAVLITGETGTGKELVARALHFDGPRASHAFVDVNCASVPAQLMESELFGFERGAFTDAKALKIGLFESANNGSLFLDEIGDMDVGLQAKLLRVLEDKKVRRLGGLRDRVVNTRIIAATNQKLQRAIALNTFRPDLLYRLSVATIDLPPLRERGNDVILLANHFLLLHGKRYGKSQLTLADQTVQTLKQYYWPGNIRELSNLMERAVLSVTNGVVHPADLGALGSVTGEPTANAPTSCERYRQDQHVPNQELAIEIPEQGLDLKQLEIQLIGAALKRVNGNVTKAASLLGISRDALRYRIEKYGL